MLVLLAAGCASGPWVLTSMPITNEQGHVVGRRDIMENRATREVYSDYTVYDPVKNERGEIIAYDEKVADGTVRYSLNGRRIGGTFKDLRSGAAFGVHIKPAEEAGR